jgi:hypothetical protein
MASDYAEVGRRKQSHEAQFVNRGPILTFSHGIPDHGAPSVVEIAVRVV